MRKIALLLSIIVGHLAACGDAQSTDQRSRDHASESVSFAAVAGVSCAEIDRQIAEAWEQIVFYTAIIDELVSDQRICDQREPDQHPCTLSHKDYERQIQSNQATLAMFQAEYNALQEKRRSCTGNTRANGR